MGLSQAEYPFIQWLLIIFSSKVALCGVYHFQYTGKRHDVFETNEGWKHVKARRMCCGSTAEVFFGDEHN